MRLRNTVAITCVVLLSAGTTIADAAQAVRARRAPNKVHHVEPVYPTDAARVRGAVTLEITVASDGRVVDAKVLRSNPPFDQPAIDAVRQWRYDMSGVPAPFVTMVSVILTPPSRATAAPPTPRATNQAAPVASAAGLDVYAGGVTPPQQVRAEIRRLTASIESGALGKDAARGALLQRGYLHATSGAVGLARRDLDAVLADNPNDHQAHFARGLAAFPANLKEALGSFSTVIRLTPGRVDGYRARAWANLVAGEHADAVADFDEVLRREPEEAEAYRGRAWAQFFAGRYDRAIGDFTEVSRRSPAFPEGSLGLGLAHYFAGRWNDARTAFHATMRMRPVRSDARMFNTVRLDDWTRHRRVLELLEPRTRRDSGDAAAWLVSGVAAYRQMDGDPDDRLPQGGSRSRTGAAFDRAVKLSPDNVDGLMFRALYNSTIPMNFKPALAIADWSEVIRLQPSNGEAYVRRALLRAVDKESLPAAIDDATRALALSPGDTKVRALIDKLQAERLAWQQTKDRAAALRTLRAQQQEELAFKFLLGLAAIVATSEPGASTASGLDKVLEDWGWDLMGR